MNGHAAKASAPRPDWQAVDSQRQAKNDPYSTVTLLARLRGWSTSVPLAKAV